MNIIQEIVNYKREILAKQKQEMPLRELEAALDKPLPAARFKEKISSGGIHLIAEIKKASPSAGLIREDFDPCGLARSYAEAGAGCISVLTEDKYFQGSLAHLDDVRKAVALPLLRKDFILDEYQLYESKLHQADAVLLIASLLSDKEIKRFLELAAVLNLDVLFEVHDEEDLKKALAASAEVIGINARDLKDFSLDLKVLPKLLKKIPQGSLAVCESGIRTVNDLAVVKSCPVCAVLIGEALLRAGDIARQTRQFADFLKKA